jgi:hypothetical protein
MMPRLIRALSLILMAASATAMGQSASSQSHPYAFSVAAGPTRAFRGVDAPGIQGQGGIALGLRHGFGLRLEGTGHWYEERPLYPCIVQDAARCYQTIRRAVVAGTLNATYHISRFASDKGRTVPYLISGLGVYRSRRVATRYSDCQPLGLCDRNIYKLELRDTQFGWSGGVGADFDLGSLAAFAEMRLHYVYSDKPGGQPSNDYFLWPLSLGFRF